MYYISGCVNGLYKITDSKDNVTELYTKEQIYKMVTAMNLDIHGVSITSNRDLYIPCVSEDFLNDFAKTISRTVVQLRLAGFKGNFNEEITKKAQQFGIVDEGQKLPLDLKNNVVILPIQDAMMQFDNKGNYSLVTRSNKINVLDSNVADYSRLGVKAFDYMYLEIGGKEYSMSELVHCIEGIYSYFSRAKIIYIGIAPSNKMFKIKIGDPLFYIFSVKFGTVAELLKSRSKILSMKSKQPEPFLLYVSNISSSDNPSNLAVTKCTIKGFCMSLDKLKEKYKTLHDIYIKA